jgi:5-methylcytosine-specific restriction endonuclease McrA
MAGRFLSFSRPHIVRVTCQPERDKDLRRGSRQSRGYDADWERARLIHLSKEPLCRESGFRGIVVVADLVDHIIPVRDRPDLRLVSSNFCSLTQRMHDTWKRKLEAEARRLGDITLLVQWMADPATRPLRFRPI